MVHRPAAHPRRQALALRLAGLALSAAVLLAGCAATGPTAPSAPSTPSTPPPPAPLAIAPGDFSFAQARLSWLIGEEMRRSQLSGLSIALVAGQRTVWAQGFGWADVAAQRPATADTLYRVGSITKLFTATAALRLADAGRLQLDAPLSQALPDLALRSRFADTPPPTLRLVMTHHAGLPSDLGAGMWTHHPAALDSLPEAVRGSYLSHPPGRMLAYSNLGYSLLGLAVQRAAGEPYAAHVQRTLLAPLGMATASLSALADAPGLARSYRAGQPLDEPGLRDVPAGGLNASVNDLAQLARLVFAQGRAADGTQILPPARLAEMLRPQHEGLPLDLDARIGLGWFIGQGPRGLRWVGHDGATPGFSAHLGLLPDPQLGVVVLTSSPMAADALRRIASEALRLALDAQAGKPPPGTEPAAAASPATAASPLPRPPQPVAMPAALLRDAPGDYTTPFGLVSVRAEGDALKVDALDRTLDLQMYSDGLARLRYRWWGLWWAHLGALGEMGLSLATLDGYRVLLSHGALGRSLLGERIEPVPLPPDLPRWLGRYEPVDGPASEPSLPSQLTVQLLRGHVVADLVTPLFNRRVQLVLAPVPGAPDEVLIRGLGRGKGETLFLQTGADGVSQVRASGQLLRRVGER